MTDVSTDLQPNIAATEFPDRRLPLTPFERFLWSADDPQTPMVFRVLMKFHGIVDRELLEQCYNTSVARHPLLSARLRTQRNQPTWVPADNPPALIWNTASTSAGHPEFGDVVEPIDLTQEPGLRVRVTEGDGYLLVWLDFHHASCDGMGARQLIADWFHLYDRMSCDETPTLTALEPERLIVRGELRKRPGAEPLGFRDAVRDFWVTVTGRTARLAVTKSAPDSDGSGTWITERPFSVHETTQIRTQLKQRGVSINDVGIAVCMQTFARSFSSVNARHFVTVLNPVDLRLPSDRYLPAANRTGFTFLRRRQRECRERDFDTLLTSIREQTNYIKDHHVGGEFIHGLNAASRLPGALKLLQKSGLFTPSMQFTCLGDTTRGRRYGFRSDGDTIMAGQLQLDRITGFAPVAPGVPLSITACETNSRLLLSVRSSQRYVSCQESIDFSDALHQQIRQWAGLPDVS
ncbi:MAG: condensation domain-containing protein [Planctomycetaceae bacterium]